MTELILERNERLRLRADAQALLPKRVAWYARKMGVSPAAVTITGSLTAEQREALDKIVTW